MFYIAFSLALLEYFTKARSESRAVTLEDLDARPVWMRVRDATAGLLSPYL